MHETPKRDDLIFDVGMHRGEDTAYYLQKGFRVVAIEADPALAADGRARFADALADGRLTVIEGAVVAPGAAAGATVRFYRNRANSVWGTVVPEWAERNAGFGAASETIEVPALDVAACIAANGVPRYLKIDIEGMDRVCLEALAGFAQRPDFVSIESEKVSYDRLLEEIALLESLGYDRFMAVQQRGISRQREPDPVREGRRTGHRFAEGSSGLFGDDLPGPWTDGAGIRAAYEAIFRRYALFGDRGRFTRSAAGRLAVRGVCKLTGLALDGWFDTHARHRTARSPGRR